MSCDDDISKKLNKVSCELSFDTLLIENEADYIFEIKKLNSKKVNYISVD